MLYSNTIDIINLGIPECTIKSWNKIMHSALVILYDNRYKPQGTTDKY